MLKREIVEKCMNDAVLLALLCDITGKSPNAMLMMLYRNTSAQLRDIDVVNKIADYTGLTQDQILLNQKVEA